MNGRLLPALIAAATGFLLGLMLARLLRVTGKMKIFLACALLAAEYASIFLVFGEDLAEVPVLGLAAGTAGAALKQSKGESAWEFSAFAMVWWLLTILLTGDTWSAWGKQLASGAIGGAVLLAIVFLLRFAAGRYEKKLGRKEPFLTKSDCILFSLPGFYFGVAVGLFGLLLEFLIAFAAGNIRLKSRIPSGLAAAAACWVCALVGERFMVWYVGFF
ncbi:MAG: hypothetical protein ACOX78_02635 [Lachnospiraceae bacterium]|jgi:hypothetical protein